MKRLEHYIDGKLVAPLNGAYLPNVEPATGAVYCEVAAGDEQDVSRAVDAARRAFPAWRSMPARQRSDLLLAMAAGIERRIDSLARAETIDNGKPIGLSAGVDIPRAAENFRFFATSILHVNNEAYVSDNMALNYTLRQPLGVVGCISPWNLPLYLLTWKIAPALAAGNTVVAKPSEVTPMTAFLLAEVIDEAGLPPGVLNIVHGRGDQAGIALVEHPEVKAVSFTGGTSTGAIIGKAAAAGLKKVSLELGGKNPNVVFADADFDQSVSLACRAAFANQGQICLCGSRLFVEAPIMDRFVDALCQQAVALRIGDPLESTTQQGALVSRSHHEKVLAAIERARDEGAVVHVGGAPPRDLPRRCKDGFFCEPTVLSGLSHTCLTNQEEIFGPVVSVIPFENESELIAMANSTVYGLSASVFTKDVARAHRVAAELDAGTVWINCWMLRDLRVPFGGMKASGIGREGGDEALRFFTEPKNICLAMEPSPS